MKTILTFCTFLCALAMLGHAETGVVKVDRLNIRAQAKSNAETLTQLTKGDPVTILDKKTVPGEKKGMTWLKIALPEKATVWIKNEFAKEGAITAEKVNIRAGAGVNFSIVGLGHRGDKVQVIRTLGDWCEIRPLPSCSGWVSSEYVEITPEIQPAPPAEAIQPTVPSPSPGAPSGAVTRKPTSEGVEVVKAQPVGAVGTAKVAATSAEAVPSTALPPTSSPDVVSSGRPVTLEGVILSCTGFALKRPGTHALWIDVPKPHMIAYLNSSTLALDKYEGKRTQVIGLETVLSNWKNPVIEVQEIKPMW